MVAVWRELKRQLSTILHKNICCGYWGPTTYVFMEKYGKLSLNYLLIDICSTDFIPENTQKGHSMQNYSTISRLGAQTTSYITKWKFCSFPKISTAQINDRGHRDSLYLSCVMRKWTLESCFCDPSNARMHPLMGYCQRSVCGTLYEASSCSPYTVWANSKGSDETVCICDKYPFHMTGSFVVHRSQDRGKKVQFVIRNSKYAIWMLVFRETTENKHVSMSEWQNFIIESQTNFVHSYAVLTKQDHVQYIQLSWSSTILFLNSI